MATLPQPCVHYDPVVDAVTIWFQRGVKSVRTEIIDNLRLADYDDRGRLSFVELIGVSRGLRLDGLPERDRIERELRPLLRDTARVRATTTSAMTDRVVDALGTWCPVPIHLIERAARAAPAGALIELLADDPLIEVDLPAWCHRGGHALLALALGDDGYRGVVRVGG